MILKNQPNVIHTCTKIIYMVMCPNLFQRGGGMGGGFKWLDPATFNLDEYDDNSSRGCVLKVDLGYPKELHNAQ